MMDNTRKRELIAIHMVHHSLMWSTQIVVNPRYPGTPLYGMVFQTR